MNVLGKDPHQSAWYCQESGSEVETELREQLPRLNTNETMLTSILSFWNDYFDGDKWSGMLYPVLTRIHNFWQGRNHMITQGLWLGLEWSTRQTLCAYLKRDHHALLYGTVFSVARMKSDLQSYGISDLNVVVLSIEGRLFEYSPGTPALAPLQVAPIPVPHSGAAERGLPPVVEDQTFVRDHIENVDSPCYSTFAAVHPDGTAGLQTPSHLEATGIHRLDLTDLAAPAMAQSLASTQSSTAFP